VHFGQQHFRHRKRRLSPQNSAFEATWALRLQKSESREGLVVCVEMADLAAKIENARKEVADLKNKVRSFLSCLLPLTASQQIKTNRKNKQDQERKCHVVPSARRGPFFFFLNDEPDVFFFSPATRLPGVARDHSRRRCESDRHGLWSTARG
jgi:hypothetical protein